MRAELEILSLMNQSLAKQAANIPSLHQGLGSHNLVGNVQVQNRLHLDNQTEVTNEK